MDLYIRSAQWRRMVSTQDAWPLFCEAARELAKQHISNVTVEAGVCAAEDVGPPVSDLIEEMRTDQLEQVEALCRSRRAALDAEAQVVKAPEHAPPRSR